MRLHASLLLSALLTSAPLAACDDGEATPTPSADSTSGADTATGTDASTAGGTEGFTTSVSTTAAFNTLGSEDKATLCGDLTTYTEAIANNEDMRRAGCALSALIAIAMEANEGKTCDEIVAVCLAEPETPSEEETLCDGLTAADCEATVGEIAACVEAQAAQMEIFATFTCASSLESLPAEGLPEACSALETKCPELFEDEGEQPPSGGETPQPQ
jgi:hypothetical protein